MSRTNVIMKVANLQFFLEFHDYVMFQDYLIYIPVSLHTTLQNSDFFCMSWLCMPWSMSDELKIQKIKIIVIEKFCQKLKVFFVISFVKDSSRQFRSFSMHCKSKTVQLLVLWAIKVFVTCVRLQTQPNFSENKFRNKEQHFGLWKKHLSYNYYLWENVIYRDLTQFSLRMELYGIVGKQISRL